MEDVHSDLQRMLASIVYALVGSPQEAIVTIDVSSPTLHCNVLVAEKDIGRIIGKQGRTARSIRTLVAIYAAKAKQPVSVDFGMR